MNARQQERSTHWLQLAQAFARTPGGGGEKVGLAVFALIACLTLPMGLFVLLSDASVGLPPDEAKTMQILAYVLLGLGMLMVWLASYQSRVIKRARSLQESLLQAAEVSSGRVVNSLGVAQWLGRFWHADYPQASLMTHSGIFRVVIQSSGTSVLIDFTPSGFTTGSSPSHRFHWWANVLVAVERPLPAGTTLPDSAELQWIQAQGYQVQCEAGCLSARGASGLEARFKKEPASIREIFNVAAKLADVAAAIPTA